MPTPSRPRQRRRVLADGWYSWLIPTLRPLTDLLERWPPRVKALTWRSGPLRAALMLLASSRYDTLVVIRADLGWRSVLLGRALFGRRRKLVVLHFIDLPPRPDGLGGLVDRVWRPIERWAIRRALRCAQVLCEWEAELYARRFGIERERFRFIPFAWTAGGARPPLPAARERRLVVASGRAFCDWPTLFEAARPCRWELVVVCGARDRLLVERLNRPPHATVLSEIPSEQMSELLANAAVSVLPMRDAGVAQGQIRLKDAVDAGAPVVASATRSLQGYVEPGATAVVVPPADPDALRDAVARLLDDPSERERLARTAAVRAGAWTWPDYLAAVEALAHGRPTAPPAGSVSAPAAPEPSALGTPHARAR